MRTNQDHARCAERGRTAMSLRRLSARTINRFATFAHAMSNTIPTVPIRIQSGLLRSPTSVFLERAHDRTILLDGPRIAGRRHRTAREDAARAT